MGNHDRERTAGWQNARQLCPIYVSWLDTRSSGTRSYNTTHTTNKPNIVRIQAKFVGDNLGPLFRSSNVSNIHILAGDDQRYTFPWWFQDMEATCKHSFEYLYGFAVHFYGDSLISPSVLDETLEQYPEMIIINTESCTAGCIETHGPLLGSWTTAEKYILAYMQVKCTSRN